MLAPLQKKYAEEFTSISLVPVNDVQYAGPTSLVRVHVYYTLAHSLI